MIDGSVAVGDTLRVVTFMSNAPAIVRVTPLGFMNAAADKSLNSVMVVVAATEKLGRTGIVEISQVLLPLRRILFEDRVIVPATYLMSAFVVIVHVPSVIVPAVFIVTLLATESDVLLQVPVPTKSISAVPDHVPALVACPKLPDTRTTLLVEVFKTKLLFAMLVILAQYKSLFSVTVVAVVEFPFIVLNTKLLPVFSVQVEFMFSVELVVVIVPLVYVMVLVPKATVPEIVELPLKVNALPIAPPPLHVPPVRVIVLPVIVPVITRLPAVFKFPVPAKVVLPVTVITPETDASPVRVLVTLLVKVKVGITTLLDVSVCAALNINAPVPANVPPRVTAPEAVIVLVIVSVPAKPVMFRTVQADAVLTVNDTEPESRIAVSAATGNVPAFVEEADDTVDQLSAWFQFTFVVFTFLL
jgi:hypothetical protein